MRTAPHILVVDDEPGIRSLLRRGLEAEGFRVSEAAGQEALLKRLDTEAVDLITLDLALGSDDGLSLARQIRSTCNVPIVMITGKVTTEERIVGLENGADDYIAKPFHIREVLLRIRAVLGRYGPLDGASSAATAPAERHRFETGTLDVVRRELRGPTGATIDLTDAEIDLLTIFLRRPRRILSRDEIMQLLRGRSWSPLERTLDGHVARLRKKIEPQSEAPRLIKSVRGVGYVFTGDVTPD